MPTTPSAAISFLLVAGALMVLAMWWLIKALVADKLTAIKEQLAALNAGLTDHGEVLGDHHARITAIETAMHMNGCLSDRRGADRRCAL